MRATRCLRSFSLRRFSGRSAPGSFRPLSALALGVAVSVALARWAAGAPGERTLLLQAPPEESVTSVAVSPDGSLVASSSFDGRVRLYDAENGTLMRAIGAAVEPGGRTVAFSPDGRRLAVAGFRMDKRVRLWDVLTGAMVQTLDGHTEIETYAIAFSPDGRMLASAGTDKQILVWDLTTGKLRHRLTGQAFPTTALAFSPDSSTLASGGGDRAVRLWDARTGGLRRSLEGHRDWVTALAYSPDGRSLASGSSDWAQLRGRDAVRIEGMDPVGESEWKLWDTATGETRRTVRSPGRLLSLAFTPDGKSLACGIGKEVRLYPLRTTAPGRVLTRHSGAVTSVAFFPDGRTLVSGSHDRSVRRFSVPSGALVWRRLGHWEQVSSVALSPDRSLIATGSGDLRFAERMLGADSPELTAGALRLWDARTGRLLRRMGDPSEQILAVAVSADGRRVAAGGSKRDGSGVVRVWDAQSGAPAWSSGAHRSEVLALAFAPDGSSLAGAAADGMVRLHDPRTGAVTRTLAGHEGGATSLLFSNDGTTLVCGGGDGTTHVWDARSGQAVRRLRPPNSKASAVRHDRLVTSLGLSREDGTLATSTASFGPTYGEPVRLWDLRTGELKGGVGTPPAAGRPMALSPDGTILATGGKVVRLWDLRTGKRLRELTGHLKRTQSIAFSADGRILVAGGNYGTTNAWEVATGRHLVTLFAFPENSGRIQDHWMAYSPDGFYHGSSHVDNYIAWRVGEELRTPASGERRARPERVEASLKVAEPGSAAR